MDTDEMESDWCGYGCKSGQMMFYFNIKTGELRWPTNTSSSGNTIVKVRTSDVPRNQSEVCSVATQTEDYGCVNQCTSMYVDNERQMGNTERESIEIKEELRDDDTIDGNEIEEEVRDDDTIDGNELEGEVRDGDTIDGNEIEGEVRDDETIDVSQQNTFSANEVDNNPGEVSEDFRMDESLSTIITEVKGRKELLQNVQTQHDSSRQSDLIHTHTREKPFKCAYCDKSYPTKTKLNVHVRVHTGQMLYRCSYCDRAFVQRGALVDHVRTHTGEKPYQCLYCDKAFAQRGVLGRHLRTHTGEKPYKCSRCGKTFTRNTHLGDHLRTHTGEKPYECSYCNNTFTAKPNLLSHIRRHHPQAI